MPRLLAFLQFMIAGLGALALHLMVRLDTTSDHPDAIATLAPFLARYALWFFAVPILWTVAATALQNRLPAKAINAIGIVVTIALFLVIGIPLSFYLW